MVGLGRCTEELGLHYETGAHSSEATRHMVWCPGVKNTCQLSLLLLLP